MPNGMRLFSGPMIIMLDTLDCLLKAAIRMLQLLVFPIGSHLNGVTPDPKKMDLLPLITLMHLKRLLILMGMEL